MRITKTNRVCGSDGKEILFCCGHSYKHFTLVNYDYRVVPELKIPHITTLEL